VRRVQRTLELAGRYRHRHLARPLLQVGERLGRHRPPRLRQVGDAGIEIRARQWVRTGAVMREDIATGAQHAGRGRTQPPPLFGPLFRRVRTRVDDDRAQPFEFVDETDQQPRARAQGRGARRGRGERVA
jgi:hypothetical protein